jgi:membrane protein DedA with SNARE-associated domain
MTKIDSPKTHMGPFNAINYMAGVTSISLCDYVLSFFAILPGTVLYVFLGASADSLRESSASGASKSLSIAIVICGVVLGVGAIFLPSYYAKKELNRILAERRCAQEELSVSVATDAVEQDDMSRGHENVIDVDVDKHANNNV